MAQSKENTNNSARSKAAAAAQSTGAPAAQTGEKRPRTTRRPYYNRRPRRPQQPKEAATPIHIYPLGGLGEVGKNMTVYECNGDMIIVDCGLADEPRRVAELLCRSEYEVYLCQREELTDFFT